MTPYAGTDNATIEKDNRPGPADQPRDRAMQILNVLIQQTGQQEYDPITVERLITEYETLMS
jgi:hypothetical protein